MKPFTVAPLVLLNSAADQVAIQIPATAMTEAASHMMRSGWAKVISGLVLILQDAGLDMTNIAANRAIAILQDESQQLSGAEALSMFNEIQHRMFDELDSKGRFFRVPMSRARYFEQAELFGSRVSKKFPRIAEDITEAGSCYAAGRYTASVFHLMRVMEHAVQRLGSKLGILNVEKLVWQVILDQVNKAISALPPKNPNTKRLAEIASHLYNVKLAWRNEVMHPKATYTEDQAERLISSVGAFMESLSRAI